MKKIDDKLIIVVFRNGKYIKYISFKKTIFEDYLTTLYFNEYKNISYTNKY